MINKRIILSISFILLLINISCKKNYNTTGNGLIAPPDFEGKLYDQSKVVTYDTAIDSVLSTNLPVNAIGEWEMSPFGTLKADLSTTLALDPFFSADSLGDNVKILSAQILIPFFAERIDDNGTEIIVLDSVYGTGTLDIKIHELGYLLPSYDPATNLEDRRIYYSNFDFTDHLITKIGDTVDYVPSNESYITYQHTEDGEIELDENGDPVVLDSLGPHFRVKIDTSFIRHKIFDRAGDFVLQNRLAFQDYFRGIYFEISGKTADGKLMMMDFTGGKLNIAFTHEIVDENGTPDDTSDDEVITKYDEANFRFDFPKVNYYQNHFSPVMQEALNVSDMINGDERIYVKGDAASGGVVRLFDTQELNMMKENGWLVNHAELIFYVDENLSSDYLPQNLILFDKINEKLLLDMADPDNVSVDNALFGGFLEEDEDGNKFYRFKITQHIKSILEHEAVNVDLSLRVVSNPTSYIQAYEYQDPDNYNPLGVVLYGNKASVLEKRPKLILYYTLPNISE